MLSVKNMEYFLPVNTVSPSNILPTGIIQVEWNSLKSTYTSVRRQISKKIIYCWILSFSSFQVWAESFEKGSFVWTLYIVIFVANWAVLVLLLLPLWWVYLLYKNFHSYLPSSIQKKNVKFCALLKMTTGTYIQGKCIHITPAVAAALINKIFGLLFYMCVCNASMSEWANQSFIYLFKR